MARAHVLLSTQPTQRLPCACRPTQRVQGCWLLPAVAARKAVGCLPPLQRVQGCWLLPAVAARAALSEPNCGNAACCSSRLLEGSMHVLAALVAFMIVHVHSLCARAHTVACACKLQVQHNQQRLLSFPRWKTVNSQNDADAD
jgi:hypothetical protein